VTRAVACVGFGLIAAGAAVFLWKAALLGTPLQPSESRNLWRVEIELSVRGSEPRSSVAALLPASDHAQTIFDERIGSDGLAFGIRTERGTSQRVGVWRGALQGIRHPSYAFRVQLHPEADPGSPASELPPDALREAAADLPVGAEPVRELLESLDVSLADDALARTRTLFAFVSDELEAAEDGSDDALLVLAGREGSQQGRARLLVTLLRSAAVPARTAMGLSLEAPRDARELVFAEAWADGRWVPLFPTLGTMGTRPADLVVLQRGNGSVVEAHGVEAVSHRYRVLRERLRPDELSALMVPSSPLLGALSLYRLPVRTQATLRILLVIPLAALVVALFRNIVGLRTFGTFMPILIALALRDTALSTGLAMVAGVLLTGLAGRLVLDRLHLLLVPRLCVLLCLVILVVVALAIAGYGFETRDLLTGVLLPIVIFTMLIERFSIVAAEEGYRSALLLLLNSLLVAAFAYPIFHSIFAAHLMLGYPELVLCVMGLLVMIGGYTGYRLAELVRFRSLAADGVGHAP